MIASALQFLTEYIKHPRKVGAVMPSSPNLTKEMVAPIHFNDATCIVEYGPGTGVFTEEIIRRKKEETFFLIMESNESFYKKLKQRYGHHKNVQIVCDSAENTPSYLQKQGIDEVNYIVSGLPFASLPQEISQSILRHTRDILGSESTFITFQYTKFKQELFKQFFNTIHFTKINRNFPPAYVLVCNNQDENK